MQLKLMCESSSMNSETEKKIDKIFTILATHFKSKRIENRRKTNRFKKIIDRILSYGFKNYLIVSLVFFSLAFTLIGFLIIQYQNKVFDIEKNLFVTYLILIFIIAAMIWLLAGEFVYIANDIKNAEKYEELFPRYSQEIKRIISSTQMHEEKKRKLSSKEVCCLLILYFEKELKTLELRLKFMDVVTYFIAIILLVSIGAVIGVPSFEFNQVSDISNVILITSTIIVFLQSFLKAVSRWSGNTLAKDHHESILLLNVIISRP